jgi:hypothetical protein
MMRMKSGRSKKKLIIINLYLLFSILTGSFIYPVLSGCQEDNLNPAPEERVYRPKNLWPLLVLRKSEEEERISFWNFYDYAPFPFSVFSKHKSILEDTSGLHILGLYHRMRDGDEKTTLLVPFFYQRKEPEYTSTIAGPILPLLWYSSDRERQKKSFTFFPLFHHTKTPKKTLTITAPLVWYSSDREKKRSSFWSVLPPCYYVKAPEYERRYLFPIHIHNRTEGREFGTWFFWYWYFRNPYSKTIVFLPYYRHKEENKTNWAFFPFAQGGYGEGYSSWGALLLFSGHKDEKEGTSSLNLLVPVGYMSRTSPDSDFLSVLLPVGYAHSKTKRQEFRMYTPLYLQFRNPSSSLTVAGILGYKKKEQEKTTWGIVPLFWSSYGEKYRSLGFFPFAWGHTDRRDEEEQSSSLYILPPVGHMYRKTPHTVFRSFLLPLGYMYSKTSDTELKMHTPLLWYYKTPYSKSKLILWYHQVPEDNTILPIPLYYRSESEWMTTTSVLPPVFWWGRAKNYRSFVFVPFVWKFVNEEEKTDSLTVLPVYHHYLTPESKFRLVFPVYWYWSNPEYSFRNFLFLFYQHKNEERTKEGLFPFVWITKTKDYKSAVCFPLYWLKKDFKENSSSRTLFPLFHYSRSPEKKLFLGGFVLPFAVYYKTPDYRFMATPIYWDFKTAEGDKKVGFFPIIWYGEGTEFRFHAFIPLWYYFNNLKEKEKMFISLPYFYRKTPDWELRTACLLHWYYRNPFSSLTIWGPYYRKEYPGRLVQGVFPVARWIKSEKYWWFYAFPFNWGERDYEWDTKKFAVLPLYYLDRTTDEKLEMWTPLFWYKKEGDYRFHILLVPPVYREKKKSEMYGDMTGWGLFPFLWVSRGEGYRSTTLLVPPLFIKEYRDRKLDSDGLLALPVLARHRSHDMNFDMITPFYWDYNNKEERKRLTVGLLPYLKDGQLQGVVPLAKYRSTKKDLYMMTPLCWYINNKADKKRLSLFLIPYIEKERMSMVIPLYYHRTENKRTYGIFPFWRLTFKEDYYSYFFFPLLWGYKDKKEQTGSFTLFPLYYHHKGRDEDFIINPFFIRKKTPEKRTFAALGILPLFWHTSRPGYYSWKFFPVAWGHKDEGKGTKSWNVLPLLFYYKTPETKIRAYLPVHWHSSTPEHSLSVYTFYYLWKSEDGYSRQGIFPVWWRSKQKGYASRGFLPVYWMNKDKEKGRYSSTFIPLYHYRENPKRGFRFNFFPVPFPWTIPYLTLPPVTILPNIAVPVLPVFKVSWHNKEKNIHTKHTLFGPIPLIQDKVIDKQIRVRSWLWYLYRKVENLSQNKTTIEIPWAYTTEWIKGELTYKSIGPLGCLYVYDKINKEKVYLLFIRKKLK